jgi:hypothetical protein
MQKFMAVVGLVIVGIILVMYREIKDEHNGK